MEANPRAQRDVADQMMVVRRRFLDSIDGRLTELRRMITEEQVEPAPREQLARRLHRHIHDMCGCAGMVGLDDLDALARKTLPLVQDADLHGRTLTAEERDILALAFDRIEALAAKADAS